MNPKISILTPSFNHEKFVGFFIESVLKQTLEDFELIIVDDCSSDHNVNEILKFKDSRIKLIQHPYNQGINAGLNTAFENASGEYLVFCASDDMLTPNALEVIYKAFSENPSVKAIYPSLIKVDENGVKDKERFGESENKTRAEHLYDLFMRGNYLTSPGMAMKTTDFKEILYPLDIAMCNQQDTQMHIKILLNGEIKILDDILVMYRFDPRTNNVSAGTDVAIKRGKMEIERLMDTFLAMKDIDLLQKIFAKEIAKLGITPQEDMIEYFLGRMALLSPIETRQMWGYHKVMESYNTKESAKRLKDMYDFDFKAYLGMLYHTEDKIAKKYRKYKKLFNIFLGVNIALCGVIVWLIW
ncbi:glycosyltransferase [Helicobacter bilis]|uniref:glycosyltransferase family 2 protein n=1 Tax=Helicobacter bilis TaxID=37372 RepID=UPI0026EA5534|nr:glycosyltransferase [Helicobacter bilis]MCI7411927.1 glycosyltransferase [Helicobacter bilis]MDD7297114.1 glycosyltransferase [Helicobacter bilis]MDY4399899.1 glycosyltransferase [Helicobacter bilis]